MREKGRMEVLRESGKEEMEVEPVFVVREIDLDYEFDAAQWFDLSREESEAEARQAELWFETARGYPQSPFVPRLVFRDAVSHHASSPCMNPEDGERTRHMSDYVDEHSGLGAHADSCEKDNGMQREFSAIIQHGDMQKVANRPVKPMKGFTFSSHISCNKMKGKLTCITKTNNSSTLMKPTASHLAKQIHSRLQISLTQSADKNFCNASGYESQATKRQKLEGGLLRKVVDTRQQTTLFHKTATQDGTHDKRFRLPMMKLTLPREPDLVTANRARTQGAKDGKESEFEPLVPYRLRAPPCNKKILETPRLPSPKKSPKKLPEFYEYHLKTSERATKRSAAAYYSHQCNDHDKGSENPKRFMSAELRNTDTRRSRDINILRRGLYDIKCNIKAFPPDKEAQMEKEVQPSLPIELFGKLSISAEVDPKDGFQFKLHQPNQIYTKGSKDHQKNRLQAEHEITHIKKEKPYIFSKKPIQCRN